MFSYCIVFLIIDHRSNTSFFCDVMTWVLCRAFSNILCVTILLLPYPISTLGCTSRLLRLLASSHGNFTVFSHCCGYFCYHLFLCQAISGKKPQETHQARDSGSPPVRTFWFGSKWFPAVFKVRNLSTDDKNSVRKCLRHEVFQARQIAVDRVQWERNRWFKFLYSVSYEWIPPGCWLAFEPHRKSHWTHCPNHVRSKHILVSFEVRVLVFCWFLCWL